MDITLILSVILVIMGTMTVFSRQPFFSIFSFVGLVFTMMLIYMTQGNTILAVVILLAMGSVALVIIVQLFMNLDLEKEFQQFYKMNVVPTFGMMIMGIILGVLALVMFGNKDIFIGSYNQIQMYELLETPLDTYDNIILLSVLGLLGVITAASLLLLNQEDPEC
jgi:NADH:ubiquinone oxidoreductase subunit 6 (subunit J)